MVINCRKLQIWSYLLKKSFTENFIFYAVSILSIQYKTNKENYIKDFQIRFHKQKVFKRELKKLTNSGLRKVLLHRNTIDFQVLSSQLSCKKILLDCWTKQWNFLIVIWKRKLCLRNKYALFVKEEMYWE